MSNPVYNAARNDTAIALLTDVYKEKGDFVSLFSSFSEQTQELETVLFQIFNGFNLDTAEGAQLNAIGEIVGEPRLSLPDDRYRLRIRARVLLNVSSGTPNQILNIAKVLGAITATYTPRYPAGFEINIMGTGGDIAPDVVSLVQEATPAGVSSNTLYSLSPVPELFSFSSQLSTVEIDSQTGFSDTSQVTGGKLAGASEI